MALDALRRGPTIMDRLTNLSPLNASWKREPPKALSSLVASGMASNGQVGFLAMNKFERRPIDAGEAKIEFLDGDFRMLRPGAYVRCAVTGDRSLSTSYAIGALIRRRLTPVRPRR